MPTRTAAVDRILTRSAALAASRGATAIGPGDLLAALLVDESRGAELLSRYRVTASDGETLTVCGQTGVLTAPADAHPFPPPPPDAVVEAVLDAAGRLARLAGRETEIGSEHLAAGLADADSPVRDLLLGRGATPAALRRDIAGPEGPQEVIPTNLTLDTATVPFDRRHLLRAIDAAANRAAEGLRVAEDVARFLRDDAFLTGELKRLRHGIVAALAGVPLADRLAARDTRGDVGAVIASPSAATRTDDADLLAANLHRAQEALRSLEEFGRLLDPALGSACERLRYETYTVEKCLAAAEAAHDRLSGRTVYVLLTRSTCVLPMEELIHAAVAGGAGVFQVREKQMPDGSLLAHLRAVRRWTRDAGGLLIVNDRPDLAVLCDADGVHVGQTELLPREARRIVGPGRLVGVSTHTIEQARAAVLDGADYLGVGPVYPSRTKTFGAYAGLAFVREVAAEIGLPWYAIGGIEPHNAAAVREAGATRAAVSAAVCGADDPRSATASLRDTLAR